MIDDDRLIVHGSSYNHDHRIPHVWIIMEDHGIPALPGPWKPKNYLSRTIDLSRWVKVFEALELWDLSDQIMVFTMKNSRFLCVCIYFDKLSLSYFDIFLS